MPAISGVCYGVCFGGMFRGMLRGMFRWCATRVPFLNLSPPKKHKPIYIYIYVYDSTLPMAAVAQKWPLRPSQLQGSRERAEPEHNKTSSTGQKSFWESWCWCCFLAITIFSSKDFLPLYFVLCILLLLLLLIIHC